MLKLVLSRMPDVFSPASLTLGGKYCKNNRILSLRLSEGLLKGMVKGDTGALYDVCADLKNWPAKAASCTCSRKTNCEHAAACFFAIQPDSPFTPVDEAPIVTQPIKRQQVITLTNEEWFSEIEEQSNGFFSYQLGIKIEGKTINILPLVLHFLNKWDGVNINAWSDSTYVELPLGTNKIIKVPLGRIKPLINFLLHLRSKGGIARLKHYQLYLIEELEAAFNASQARWHTGEKLRQKLQQLTTIQCSEMSSLPQGLMTNLRDYQHQGLTWLQRLRMARLGGILADDMGLGKTVQTLAHLQLEKEEGRLTSASLIIAPTSLLWNWLEEAARFTPSLKVLVFHGTNRHTDSFDDYDVIISTYSLVQRDKLRFLSYCFYYFILDEAQFIKNARAKTTQAIQQIQATHRLCLSGTPVENHLGELWSLFHFLMPGLLGDTSYFKTQFKTPIEKQGDAEKQRLLIHRIKPFILRRTKSQVARELPEKTEVTTLIEVTGPQRDLYEIIRISMEKRVREAIALQGIAKSHLVFLDALLKLRQVCCDPRLVSIPEAKIAHGHSAKLTALMDLITNLMAENRRVLIFSQFTSMLVLIEQKLKEYNYHYLKLTGQTTHRQELIKEFQEGNVPLFLISLKAGGTGLNLTRADTVIHYDPWWNPKVEDQATDRTHRIGQKQPVFVYKLIAAGTVEEAMLALQAKKRQLVEGILNEQFESVTGLQMEDIAAFFDV